MSAECSRCGADLDYSLKCARCIARSERDEAVTDRIVAERDAAEWREAAKAECRLREDAEDRRDRIEREAGAYRSGLQEIEAKDHEYGPGWFAEIAADVLDKYPVPLG